MAFFVCFKQQETWRRILREKNPFLHFLPSKPLELSSQWRWLWCWFYGTFSYNTITLLVSQCLQARVAFFETRNFMDLKPKHVKWLMTPKFFNSFVFASKKHSKKPLMMVLLIIPPHIIASKLIMYLGYIIRGTIKNVILQFPCPIAMPMYRSECIIKTVHKVRNNSL